MIHIEEQEKDIEFASPMYFDRSEKVKRRLSELDVEEMRDLTKHLLNGFEEVHGNVERAAELVSKADEKAAELLGWKEDMNEGSN